MTDTTHYADVLLPATTFLEGYDIPRAYGPIGLRLARPVIEAVGEARSNADVFGELSRLLELSQDTDPVGEIEEMLDVFSKMPAAIGDALRDHGAAVPPYGGRPVQFVDVMPRTSDGKVDLFPAALDREAPAGLYTYRPDPATTRVPARADLTGQRAHDQLDAGGTAATGSAAADASERCGGATSRRRRRRAHLQRARRSALQPSDRFVDSSRHGVAARKGCGDDTPRTATPPTHSSPIR